VLGRLFRAAFSYRSSSVAIEPTPEHVRLMDRIVATALASGAQDLVPLLDELDSTQPKCAAAHRYVGSHLGRLGLLRPARAQLEAAAAIDPDHPGAWTDLGNVHRIEGRNEEAAACYRRALVIAPDAEDAQLGAAACDSTAGRTEAAVERLRGCVRANPSPAAVQALVELFDRLRRYDDAKDLCVEVLSHHPHHGAAQAALGFLLLKRELKPEEALGCFERAVANGYREASLWSNRGIALQDLGRLDEALASYDEALALAPDHRLARFHRSLARLMKGEFAEAWDDYELRLVSSDRQSPPCGLPVWNGEPTRDALLVCGEQGIGDEIMFASCLPDLLRSCPSVVLACTEKLQGIFRRSFPQVRVIALNAVAKIVADTTVVPKQWVAIGSLPGRFRRTLTDFPRHEGYLQADPRLVSEYRDRLGALGPEIKVGLCWRGGTEGTRRMLRSIDLATLKPLLDLPGTRIVNLQHDSRNGDSELVPFVASGAIVHWQDALDDYERTAALVASLDIVVSVCTAAIHLSGALGRPTVVMAPFSPEWRYGISGAAMPWYPAVHIERQRAAYEWGDVIQAVHARLVAFCVEHVAVRTPVSESRLSSCS